MENNKFYEVCTKNRKRYYFDDLIKLEGFENLLKITRKSFDS